jgi:hypothetical protein
MLDPNQIPAGQPPRTRARRVWGSLLIVIGLLLVGVSGLCAIAGGIGYLGEGDQESHAISAFIAVVSGLFILLGALLLWGGARLRRRGGS